MTSNKRDKEIKKSVQESILDAVTQFQKEEPSYSSYNDGSQTAPQDDRVVDDNASLALWESILPVPPAETQEKEVKVRKAPAPAPAQIVTQAKLSEVTELISNSRTLDFNAKLFGDQSRSTTIAGSPSRPPVFGKGLPSSDGSPNFDFSVQALANLNSVQLKLYEGDHLKIAQQKITDLEREVDRLRLENERLAAATELFQKRSEENLVARQDAEKKLEFNEERFSEERVSLKSYLEQRESAIKELREKNEELESRLSNDIRRSRSRERELENRLELARLEKMSLVGSKDELILDLKRQVDQLNHELGNYRRKATEMNQTLDANQEQFRRTVRALRLALTNLEVNEQIGSRSKKAD